MCYGENMAGPFSEAWSLIKNEFNFSGGGDDDDDSEPFAGKTEAEREEFMASLRREWAKPEDEQFLNYHFDSGPYWALDERQKKVAGAALNLPPSFLKEEANEMEGHFTRLFAEGHHEIPDHEFDRAEAIINNFGQQIETHEADPNSNQSLEFMQDFNDPNHPWTKAVESYTGYDDANNWQTKNTGEPMEIAMRLLKEDESHMQMIFYLREQAYELAKQNMPYGINEYPSREEYENNLMEVARPIVEKMMYSHEYQDLRDTIMERIKGQAQMTEGQDFSNMQFDNNNFQDKLASEPMEIAFQLLKDRQTILPIDGQKGFLSHAPFNPNPRNSLQIDKLTGKNNPKNWLPDNHINRKNVWGSWPSADKYTSEKIKQPPLSKPIPSHIEWDGDLGRFSLRGTGDEKLSEMLIGNHYGGYEKMPSSATGISSTTPEAYRRQGHYDKLMRGLINAGISVGSNERNSDSQPFHEKFQNRMTPNMKIEYGNESDGSYMQPLTYSRKPDFPTYGDSDLAQGDYGARPIQQLPPQPQNNRPTIGSVQTSFPVIDDNFEDIKPLHSMNPIIPISSLMTNN